MNTIGKITAASALALGFGVAHASILDPSSGGDILLFAEVLNGSAVVGSYAGDSGILIGTSLSNGTLGNLSTSTDAPLAQLLALATGTNTIEWAVEGGRVTEAGVWFPTDQFVTTIGSGGNLAQLSLRTGTNTQAWSDGLTQTINEVDTNSNGANSVFATSTAAGGIFDSSSTTPNIATLFSQGTTTYTTGLGSTTLYHVGEGAGQTSPIVVAGLGTVTLTSTGLSFTASGGGTSVPLPAAVWLLGSGLLGLAGVGRRKLAAA